MAFLSNGRQKRDTKKKKKNKDEVPIKDFRRECRDFAEEWIKIHIKEFKRLGVIGDFENYYSTMSFDAEAQIVRELGKFLLDKSLYQGFKPVLWSTVEKTALADAEVEYLEHTSNTIYVSFKVSKTKKSWEHYTFWFNLWCFGTRYKYLRKYKHA